MKNKIPISLILKKKMKRITDFILDIDTDDILGIFIAVVLYAYGLSIAESLIYGIIGYLVYLRLEKTLFKYAILFNRK